MELLNAMAYAIGNCAIRRTVRRTRYALTRMVMTVISLIILASIIAGVVQAGSISATFHDLISTMITGFQRVGVDVFLQRIVDIMRNLSNTKSSILM